MKKKNLVLFICFIFSSILFSQEYVQMIQELASIEMDSEHIPGPYVKTEQGDLNGDGYDDLVLIMKHHTQSKNHYANEVYIYLGSETFDNTADYILSVGDDLTVDFAINVSYGGDINGDGYDDLIISSNYNNENVNKLEVYFGSETFDTEVDHVVEFDYEYNRGDPYLISSGDFNGDGYDDIVTGCADFWIVYFGPEMLQKTIEFGYVTDYMLDICMADFNGDGCDEIGTVLTFCDEVGIPDPDGFGMTYTDYLVYSIYACNEDLSLNTIRRASLETMPHGNDFSVNDIKCCDKDNDGCYDVYISVEPSAKTHKILGSHSNNFIGVLSQFNIPLFRFMFYQFGNEEKKMLGFPNSTISIYEELFEEYSVHSVCSLGINCTCKTCRSIGDINNDGYDEFVVLVHDFHNHCDVYKIYTQSKVLANQDNDCVPVKLVEAKNYPNPFNPTTTIEFNLPKEGDVELSIYNIKGQCIKNYNTKTYDAGINSVVWNGTNNSGKTVSSGVYYYKLKANDDVVTNKMVLLK